MALLKFTLDTNCLYDLSDHRPNAEYISKLAAAHSAGIASVAVVAMAASELQKDGTTLSSFSAFEDRLRTLNLAKLDVLKPMCYFDVTFWDWCLYSEDEMIAIERAIHDILFPKIEFSYEKAVPSNSDPIIAAKSARKWRNAKCDVQSLWCHIWGRRDIFVTSDKNFHKVNKRTRLEEIGAGTICDPKGAVEML